MSRATMLEQLHKDLLSQVEQCVKDLEITAMEYGHGSDIAIFSRGRLAQARGAIATCQRYLDKQYSARNRAYGTQMGLEGCEDDR